MKTIAIIPAREGSKRIPHKNIMPFCGQPILAYSIRAALESESFHEVMVSTDSSSIMETAVSLGASVPFLRSSITAGDHATTAEVISEVLSCYENLGKRFDILCCLYPTAPFVTPHKLNLAINILKSSAVNAVVPVVRYSYPPQRALQMNGGELAFCFPENEKVRSQDLAPLFHDCGQFYMIKTEAFKRYQSLFPPHSTGVEMPETEVQDIDTAVDWRLAEIKFSRWREEKK